MAGMRESMKDFYFSGAKDFGKFKAASEKRTQVAQRQEQTKAITAAAQDLTRADLLADLKSEAAAAAPADTQDVPRGKLRPDKPKPSTPPTADSMALVPVSQAAALGQSLGAKQIATSAGAASPEYIQFLKQQQDLQKIHQKMQELIASLENSRRTHMTDIGSARQNANTILSELEAGTNWNLQSKYTVQALTRDCGLKLQPIELYREDKEPNYLEVLNSADNLKKLKEAHGMKETYNAVKAVVDNGLRRVDKVEKEIRGSNIDGTDIARLPDTLLIQLDHVLGTPTIVETLTPPTDRLLVLSHRIEEERNLREQALDDGEMQVAEQHYYKIVEAFEECMVLLGQKIGATEAAQRDNVVLHKVRETNSAKAANQCDKLKDENAKLKARCEHDLDKIFQLKEKVDAVEKSTQAKVAVELQKSDALLAENVAKQQSCWAKIEALERELEALEQERYQEVRRRVEEKEKDEHRRIEFDQFCRIADAHARQLDLTIRNCDTYIHCVDVMRDLVVQGFTALEGTFDRSGGELVDLKLGAHQQHLEVFRGLYLALGELIHKKERKIDEIDRMIQNSHIQQELAMETLNPQAKKFSDAKKQLLKNRDEVELEVEVLRGKAQKALEDFKISELALAEAGIEYIHPTIEQQQATLEQKARMVEYKAISIGNVDAVPVKREIEELKQQLSNQRQLVATVNAMAMFKNTLPQIPTGSPVSLTASNGRLL